MSLVYPISMFAFHTDIQLKLAASCHLSKSLSSFNRKKALTTDHMIQQIAWRNMEKTQCLLYCILYQNALVCIILSFFKVLKFFFMSNTYIYITKTCDRAQSQKFSYILSYVSFHLARRMLFTKRNENRLSLTSG